MFALIVCAGTVLSAGLDGAFFFASRFCFVVTHVENLCGDGQGVPEVFSVCRQMFGKP